MLLCYSAATEGPRLRTYSLVVGKNVFGMKVKVTQISRFSLLSMGPPCSLTCLLIFNFHIFKLEHFVVRKPHLGLGMAY